MHLAWSATRRAQFATNNQTRCCTNMLKAFGALDNRLHAQGHRCFEPSGQDGYNCLSCWLRATSCVSWA